MEDTKKPLIVDPKKPLVDPTPVRKPLVDPQKPVVDPPRRPGKPLLND